MSGFLNVNFARPMPVSFSTFSKYSGSMGRAAVKRNYAGAANVTWGTANLVVFSPVAVSMPVTVSRIWWMNGDAISGNVDCGIFTPDGTLVLGAGNTAQATANARQHVDVTDTLLPAGLYYIGVKCEATGAGINVDLGVANMEKILGAAQASGAAGSLAASYTLAACARAGVPMAGFTAVPRTY